MLLAKVVLILNPILVVRDTPWSLLNALKEGIAALNLSVLLLLLRPLRNEDRLGGRQTRQAC